MFIRLLAKYLEYKKRKKWEAIEQADPESYYIDILKAFAENRNVLHIKLSYPDHQVYWIVGDRIYNSDGSLKTHTIWPSDFPKITMEFIGNSTYSNKITWETRYDFRDSEDHYNEYVSSDTSRPDTERTRNLALKDKLHAVLNRIPTHYGVKRINHPNDYYTDESFSPKVVDGFFTVSSIAGTPKLVPMSSLDNVTELLHFDKLIWDPIGSCTSAHVRQRYAFNDPRRWLVVKEVESMDSEGAVIAVVDSGHVISAQDPIGRTGQRCNSVLVGTRYPINRVKYYSINIDLDFVDGNEWVIDIAKLLIAARKMARNLAGFENDGAVFGKAVQHTIRIRHKEVETTMNTYLIRQDQASEFRDKNPYLVFDETKINKIIENSRTVDLTKF